ncbi:tetratricopeptide repeat protein [Muribaculaceae bacterium Isolate-002 (NCI)]|nr:tetratricopeptide repeat protein [Muribaculaceae bacterium Isolate-002 (NCI)]
MKYWIVFLPALVMMMGCGPRQHDQRLANVEATISKSPKEALALLDSIDITTLSEADRYYYDFLSVKAGDKAYIEHASDTTILKVIDYYADKDDALYVEALYYGGRVYSDMGDTPTALQYFHEALDNFSDESPDLDLKANILSQTGRLLTSINLFDEAVPYIEEAIAIGEQRRDTLNMVYDIQLLGGTYRRAREFNRAELLLSKALDLSSNLPPSIKAKSRMALAEIKFQQGANDSALELIRSSIDCVSPMARNNALAYATKIYFENGILDTAYIYANQLLDLESPLNKGTAYQALLSSKLRNFIPLDTIHQYISEYREFLENYYDSNKMQLAINKQNYYNYQLHERERKKAETFNRKLIKWIFGISFLCILLAVIILYYKNKAKKTLLHLHGALNNIDRLNENISVGNHDLKSTYNIENEQELREKLKNKLLSIYNENVDVPLSKTILESEVYNKLLELIKDERMISYDDIIWQELEETVIKSSPDFKYNLHLLIQSHMTTIDFHTALLIKCHIQPSQMAMLLGRTKGAIVSRRDTLSLKIFGEKKGTKIIDGIIRLL